MTRTIQGHDHTQASHTDRGVAQPRAPALGVLAVAWILWHDGGISVWQMYVRAVRNQSRHPG